MTHINQDHFDSLVESSLNKLSLRHDSIMERGREDLKSYLDSANITANQKAEIYANFASQVTTTMMQQVLGSVTQMVTRDAELTLQADLQDAQITQLGYQNSQIQEQTSAIAQKKLDDAAESSARKSLLENQALSEYNQRFLIEQNKELVIAQKNEIATDSARKTSLNTAQIGLIEEQENSEIAKNKAGGLIEKESLLKGKQGDAYDKHRYEQGLAAMSNLAGLLIQGDADFTDLGGSTAFSGGLLSKIESTINALES